MFYFYKERHCLWVVVFLERNALFPIHFLQILRIPLFHGQPYDKQ